MFYVSLKLYPSEIRKKERYPLFCKEDIFPFYVKVLKNRRLPDFLRETLENGGTLRGEKNYTDVKFPEELPEEKMDNRILKTDQFAKKTQLGRGEQGRKRDQDHPAGKSQSD